MKNSNKNITKIKQNNNFIVYIHIRPDINEPFYVGKGIPKRDRSKYGRNQHWHNIVNKNNGIFESKILFEGLSEEEALLKEIELEKELKNQIDIKNAINIPMIGAKKIKLTVLIITAVFTASRPAAAIPAPANPPINVCEEEEGMPNHQVNKFHAIAAINPAKITCIILPPSTTSALTVLATVLATPW